MTLAADSSSPSEPPRDPADYGRRRPLMGLTFWLLLAFGLICALGGGAVAWFGPKLFPPMSSVAPPVAAPAAAPVASPAPLASPAPQAPEGPAPSAEVAALQDRLVALESAQGRTADAAAAALAASALVEAARGSRPFVDELAAVERLLPPTAEVRSLRRLAETGAPSRSALADDFDAAAARAAVAARAPTDGSGFFDQLAYAFASVIAVRRVNITTGDAPDAVLARAEQLIDDGDLDGALATLDGLPPKAREALSAWRGRAERRAAIDRATAAIRAAAMADLAKARP